MYFAAAFLLLLWLPLDLNAADNAADAQQLSGAEFMEHLSERRVEFTPAQSGAILEFLKDNEKATQLAEQLQQKKMVLLADVLPHLVNTDGSLSVLATIKTHPDAMLKFVANCCLAGSGDSEAAAVIHGMLHDEHLSVLDQRLLKTWALGAGINPAKDDAHAMLQHLTTLMAKTPKLKAGDACPAFRASTQAGVALDSEELKGKLVVFHFWSSSCGPCLAQMPRHIEVLSQLSQDEAVIVFVSLDEDEDQFQAMVEKYSMPFHNVCDGQGWGGPLARSFGVNRLPLDVIIAPNGKVLSNSVDDLADRKK